MFNYRNYGIYRQDLTKNIEGLIPQDAKKILVFGDKFHTLEYKWLKNNTERKIINLDQEFKNWTYISDHNPEITLDLEKKSFDLIISYHGLERSLDPDRLILELRRLLNSNGIFIFITYNVSHIYSLYNTIIDNLEFKSDGAFKEGYIQRFSYKQIKNLFENTGLIVESEMLYGLEDESYTARQMLRITKNPYLNVLSFIFTCKKTEKFPFIESAYL